MNKQPSSSGPHAPLCTEVLDGAIALADESGVKEVQWLHILEAFARTPRGHGLLEESRVSTSSLLRDCLFMRVYMPEMVANSTQADGPELLRIRALKEQAVRDQDFSLAAMLRDKETEIRRESAVVSSSLAAEVEKHIATELTAFVTSIDFPVSASERGNIRRLLMDVFKTSLERSALPDRKVVDSVLRLRAQIFVNYLITENAKTEVIQGFADSLKEFQRFSLGRHEMLGDFPEAALREFQGRERHDLTPRQLFDLIWNELPYVLHYLVYRAGKRVEPGYSPSFQLPPADVVSAAVAAYQVAESRRDGEIVMSHFAQGFIDSGRLYEAFSAFKIPNVPKFLQGLPLALFPEDEDEKFRTLIAVSAPVGKMVRETGIAASTVEMRVKMTVESVLNAEEVKAAFLKAGFPAKDYSKFVEKAVSGGIEEAKSKSKSNADGFKVSDDDFEAHISKFGIDLSQQVKSGKLPLITDRDEEVEQMLTILLQEERGNPLLLGEAGVGKSALFGALAQRIATGKVPKELKNARVVVLDMNNMVSGTMYRGMFEERLFSLVGGASERNATKKRPPIFFCIDELHNAMGAGKASGADGAGEMLKSHITGGDLKIIGATTEREYAQHVVKDAALERRFDTVKVGEPQNAKAKRILLARAKKLGEKRGLSIDKALVCRLVDLCDSYVTRSHQPDKSIRCLDHAFAIARLEGAKVVSDRIVERSVARAANIAPEFIHMDDHSRFLRLREELPKAVVGQGAAVEAVINAVFRTRAGLNDPKQPLGNFLFLGPTGVGKTEMAKSLARLIYGTEDALVKIPMSEYGEAAEFTKLTGASPQWVGHGEEGVLTGAVRRRPHCIILFDEFEKAHRSIQQKLLNILEEGTMTDGLGQSINFRGCTLVITSNLGADGGDYEEAAKSFFLPEFLNRMTAVIPFRMLDRETVNYLTRRELDIIVARAAKKVSLSYTEAVVQLVADKGYSAAMGAREMKRAAAQLVSDPLASIIVDGERDSLLAEVVNGEVVYHDVPR